MNKLAWFACAIGCWVSALLGYKYAAALYTKDIANMKAAQAAATQKLEARYRAQEQENAQRLVAALDERDKALASVGNLRADLDRLRESARRATKSRPVSGAHGTAINSYAAKLASCQRLLIEGAELLQQGADLVGRTAADKDAVIKIKQQ